MVRAQTRILGVDFTSRPTSQKPITVAVLNGSPEGNFVLTQLRALTHWVAFEELLLEPGPWIGAFDFPFGLPRELVLTLGWPEQWTELISLYRHMTRAELRETFRAFCHSRPEGSKFAHRATDRVARSSPSMKWVNPPVAYMLHAGAPRLLDAGVDLPGLRAGDRDRVALEGYPAILARSVTRLSYKTDKPGGDDMMRRARRESIVQAIESGQNMLNLSVTMAAKDRLALVTEPSADRLDALLCAAQAAWAWLRQSEHFGMPDRIDPVEGWIITSKESRVPSTLY